MIIVGIIGLYCANPLHATTHYKNTASDIFASQYIKLQDVMSFFHKKLTKKIFPSTFLLFCGF